MSKDDDNDLWMSENRVRSIHHVIKHLALDLGIVVLVLHLDEVGLLNSDLESTARLYKRVVD